jgi:hypothetical protein
MQLAWRMADGRPEADIRTDMRRPSGPEGLLGAPNLRDNRSLMVVNRAKVPFRRSLAARAQPMI